MALVHGSALLDDTAATGQSSSLGEEQSGNATVACTPWTGCSSHGSAGPVARRIESGLESMGDDISSVAFLARWPLSDVLRPRVSRIGAPEGLVTRPDTGFWAVSRWGDKYTWFRREPKMFHGEGRQPSQHLFLQPHFQNNYLVSFLLVTRRQGGPVMQARPTSRVGDVR
jgi:hypothetical protein